MSMSQLRARSLCVMMGRGGGGEAGRDEDEKQARRMIERVARKKGGCTRI